MPDQTLTLTVTIPPTASPEQVADLVAAALRAGDSCRLWVDEVRAVVRIADTSGGAA